VKLLRGDGPPLRIGHRGAAALSPPNTIAAIEAALELEVDMVELDVLALPDGKLVLGHSLRELAADPTSLDHALDLVAQRPGTALLADVKRTGYEGELVDALRRHDLLQRTLASSADLPTLQALRRVEPALARGRTYPRHRLSTLLGLRAAMPWRIERLLAEADASVATLQYRLVSRAVVECCHARGAAVFAWTVNNPALLARLERLGVDGLITDDPRVFGLSRATLQA